MKKVIVTVWLLGCVSCIPVVNNYPISTLTAIPAIERASTTTSLPQITPTVIEVGRKEYDPNEWKIIYNKDTVWQSDISPTGQIWIMLGRGEVAFLDKDQWILFSSQDYGFTEDPSDIAIGSDGVVWISGRQAISRYQNGQWHIFPIPNISATTVLTRLAIDPFGAVWIATPLCYCEKSIKRFDGTRWEEFSVTDKHLEARQLLFTPNGVLWASYNYPGNLGSYDGKNWKIIPGTYLWPNAPNSSIEIASDKRGNIYTIFEKQEWIVKIDQDGGISKIPFAFSSLEFNPAIMRIFIDSQDTIWVNACLKNRRDACLAYYKDGQWVSLVNLPFTTVTGVNEMSDETLLVATVKGLYKFRPEK